ncbi:MAG: hypothetical protein KDK97_01215 [Verrucomicrobiales bacterium]|nr:hypothetical protein [Verrucomicrobiales bacterium]MCP5559068.1 hypothetical protein [Verrucomicrobiaceae bacterium]
MKTSRIGTHLTSVLLLLLWSAVMLYFYASGRIASYLQEQGIFQPMVLIGGIGLAILGLFNLVTMGAEEADCCEHDHDYGHDHGHDDHHHHEGGCCDHDHKHDHAHHSHDHDHAHAHGDCCDHDHSHSHSDCGHDHSHDEGHAHAHGILEESGPLGRLFALAILAVPISYAAVTSPDAFSARFLENKGAYSNVVDAAGLAQHSLKNKAPQTNTPATSTAPSQPTTVAKTDPAASAQPGTSAPAAKPTVAAGDLPPATVATTDGKSAPTDPNAPPAPGEEMKSGGGSGGSSPDAGKTAQSYGSFTLEDLKAQVPQSKEGNFILDVPEIYYTGGDVEVQRVLTGQSVETIAQVLPEKVNNAEGNRIRIFRLLVQCCAADARPYSVPVDFGKKAPEYKDMTWVKVTGTMSYQKEGDQTVPVLNATKIEETTAPSETTLY